MIDLDDFKKVNDTYGHKIGDEVLTGLADFLQVSLHSEEVRYMAGRWGGEEFMIVLPGMHAKDAAVIAEKLRNGCKRRSRDCGKTAERLCGHRI